jgi:hypothetical protein
LREKTPTAVVLQTNFQDFCFHSFVTKQTADEFAGHCYVTKQNPGLLLLYVMLVLWLASESTILIVRGSIPIVD